MEAFKTLVREVVEKGQKVNTVKGPTRRILGAVVHYDVSKKLPVITSKKTNYRWALVEMTMFIKGITDLSLLAEYGAEKLWEKQGLSEDVTDEAIRHPNDVIPELAKAMELPEEDAKAEFYSWTTQFQADMTKVHDEARAMKNNTPEEVQEFLQTKAAELTLAFEKRLTDLGVHVREQRVTTAKGYLGPIYGEQWLNWEAVTPQGQRVYINQLEEAAWKLTNTPDSRQIMVTAWNPARIARETFSYDQKIKAGYMGQAPCHVDFQFISTELEEGKRQLDIILHLRSNDLMLGHGFNAIGYAALVHLMAAKVGMQPGGLHVLIGDCHIYENHMPDVAKYLNNEIHEGPTFSLPEGIDLDNFTADDLIKAVGEYTTEAYIPFELNV